MRLRSLAVLLFCSTLISPAQQQQQQTTQRKKIALTLGGGGALGLAHVGVLEWLEEKHIPVDYVTGTSMGALIGGIYASGMSAKEVRQLASKVEWGRVFRGGPDYKDLRFRRKEDRRAFPNPIEFGLKGGLRTPSGFTSGQGLILLLNQLFIGYPADRSFDDLPTPFRCVATDLVSGDRVEFDRGSLAEALRASSAIPGFFVPVRRQGQVLVDGGIVDNLPVDAALSLGADVVIASVLPIPKLDPEDIQGLGPVAGRAVSIAVLQNERRSLRKATHVIEPGVADFDSADYEKHDLIMQKGYDATAKQAATFLPYALNDADWKQFTDRRAAMRRPRLNKLEFVEVSGGSKAAREDLQKELKREIDEDASRDRIELLLSREFGTMRYNWIDYSTSERDGQSGLQVRLFNKRHGPPFVFFTPEIRGEDAGRANLNLSSRLVFTEFLTRDAELRADISVGSRTLLGAEYYRRLGLRGFFVAPRASFSRTQTNLYELGLRAGEADINRSGIGIDAGFTSARFLEIRAGFDYGRASASTRVGSLISPDNDGMVRSLSLRFQYDGQDSPQVPRRGFRTNTAGMYYFNAPLATRGFPFAQMDSSYFHTVAKNDRVFVQFGGSSSFGTKLAIPLQVTLGGPLRLGAFGIGQFRGDRAAYTTTGYLRQIGKLPAILGGDLFLGGWIEGGLYQAGTIGGFKQSGTLAFVAETPIGPIYAGWSLGRTDDKWRGKFSFLVGRFF
jgi:NTE family protein